MSDAVDGGIKKQKKKGRDSLSDGGQQLFRGQPAGIAEHPITADSEVYRFQWIGGVQRRGAQQ